MGDEDSPVDDLELLRAFEPAVRFTKGEYFYPVSVDRYVQRAALWTAPEGDESTLVAEPGTVDLDVLARRGAGTPEVVESLSGVVTGAERRRVTIPHAARPPRLQGGSRLAAVGLVARLVDALNRVSLVFRGSVPGGSAAASFLLQRDHLAPDEPTYYGRVVRDGSWIVCQYWFFYSFNNWRSGFGGVNEHEADWEQVTVYLDGVGEADDVGLPAPRWVVFSAHDETGDDLRRRWDDPDLSLVDGRHPVVHAGAGSHSGAYLAGDYLISVRPPSWGGFFEGVRKVARVLTPWSVNANRSGVGLPYVDYARGDGRVIGPGGDPWRRDVIDESTGWVHGFRGLWGQDTRDRLGGERGPAGPRYERDGTIRESWADPIGWAGLAKVAPNPSVEAALVRDRTAELELRLATLAEEIDEGRRGLERAAAGLAPASPAVRALADEERRVLDLQMERARRRDELSVLEASAGKPGAESGTDPGAESGADPGPHAHLRHRQTPLPPVSARRSRVLAGWAVVSTPVILYAAGLVILPTVGVSATLMAMFWLVFLLLVEGFARGRFLATLGRVVVAAAVVVGLYFLVSDWRVILGWGFVAAAVLLLVVNVRDAFRR
ncbi:hypothetical protein GCM10025865_18450 [Paraoerskovia sediminicola]|uniref:Uncharacterized protein n=1 Tax=Paraoerskovia sediminicola TaxID=1138587 RepID=A0ABN6XCI7_9CELL|nr:hypothetical protein [Paraoerskovia sediminicola]BDZ42546.1 hypothetical protein GCM10025865_18450 [Paraoerskovia sediminicola]